MAFKTAIERAYETQRFIGIADACRVMLDRMDDQADYHPDVAAIIQRYPEAALYLTHGSRPGEIKPQDAGRIAYREGVIYYHRPGNFGAADCVWEIVPLCSNVC